MTIIIILKALAEVITIALIGIVAFHLKILPEESTMYLSKLTINITYPLLIFSSVIKKFPTVMHTPYWWLLPIVNFALLGTGSLIAIIYLRMHKKTPFKREFVMLAGFHNGAYLPLVLVAALFPQGMASEYFVYIFLFTMLYGPSMISISKYLFSGETEFKLKYLISTPLIALITSILLVLLHVDNYVPLILLQAFEKVGSMTIQLILFTLGGILYFSLKRERSFQLRYALPASIIKLILVPLIFILIVYLIPMPRYMQFLLILEAAQPSALNITLLTRLFGGNYNISSQSTLTIYTLSLATLPIFTAIAVKLSGIQ